MIWDVHVDDTVRDYVVRLVVATRNHRDLALGASPRGSHALYRGAQAYAAMQARDHVLPDDVKRIAPSILAHRCLIDPESAMRGARVERVLGEILASTELYLEQAPDSMEPPGSARGSARGSGQTTN